MNEYLLAVIIGGLIALISTLISTFLVDFLRARRDLKRWKMESTTKFFRELYDPLAPFFSAQSKIIWALTGITVEEIMKLPIERQRRISYNLESVLKELLEAYKKFIDEGYVGLFPYDVGLMMVSYQSKLQRLNQIVKDKGISDKGTYKAVEDAFSIGNKLRSRLRQLLNIDALG